ncbi:flagellar hook-associated protein FlgK [Granulosicoccus sp. 3-233]|uniref:flagellar hook-associated protein FlgK n=1 Tax=Granulosicoccus sp. 3-233 TaxID=3417969 RepID=UPI003D32E30B
MNDLLNTGKSALFAFQRALATTSHNIANVNTEGYSRQRVDMEAVPANTGLQNQPGGGVQIVSIERLQDQFATARVNSSTSAFEEQNTYHAMASRLDNLMASESGSVAPAMNDFFNALQDANADPSSVATREVVLDRAEQLAQRFQSLQGQFDDTRSEVSERIQAATESVSDLARSIADVNKRITSISDSRNTEAANDLLDQRDQLVKELSAYIDIDTNLQENGALNVFMGKGISLVIDNVAQEVKAVPDDTYPDRMQIQVGSEGSEQNVSARLQGGEIGGLSEFANQTLQPAMAELGRLALSISDAVNQQHALGIDINGEAGEPIFELAAPQTYASSRNTGSGVLSAEISDTSALEASDYLLRFDGANFTATRNSDGKAVSGPMPLELDGVSLSLSGSPDVGDTFVLSATGRVAATMNTVLNNAEDIALSGQLSTRSDISNLGDSRISSARVVDTGNSSLTDSVDIVFTSNSSYDIIDSGSGATLASATDYSEGDAIEFNGWQVSISGDIQEGDSHRVEANLSGIGNNSNGMALAELQNSLSIGGNQTFNEAYGSMVSRIGAQTNSAETRATALESLRDNAIERQQATQSVSLDEEAINLTRFQQAYQASAQIISAADDMFQTILGAVR